MLLTMSGFLFVCRLSSVRYIASKIYAVPLPAVPLPLLLPALQPGIERGVCVFSEHLMVLGPEADALSCCDAD